MNSYLIKNATIVNEGSSFVGDVLIENGVIKKVDSSITTNSMTVIDASGKYLIPGLIDDQVHFREPGLTHKATIGSESRAAVAGGITTFIEMPNTVPQATNQQLLQDKFNIAEKTSYANYSFMFGGTNDKKIFSSTKLIISVHCEDEETIKKNIADHEAQYGEQIPIELHPVIRSEEACYLSSSRAIALAKKTGARLHVFHLSTAKETALFRNDIPLEEKQITSEVCVHHLWFSDQDYEEKGTHIKWNPAVKTAADREGLWTALLDDRLDIIATDHAPHTLEEKSNSYLKAPSGGPLVQHALLALLEKVSEKVLSIEKLVEKACHNPAIIFQIENRGFIKEGYFADLVLIDPKAPQTVCKENILYKCGWSPFEGTTFSSSVTHTFVNGVLMYHEGTFNDDVKGKRITFNR